MASPSQAAHRVAEAIQWIAASEVLVHANAVGAVTLQTIDEAKHHGRADQHLVKWKLGAGGKTCNL